MRYFVIAGEASGDLHAANLLKSLKVREPEAEFYAYGGDLMAAAGAKLLRHYRDIAYMGVVSVLMHARTILKAMAGCKRQIAELKPDVVILVDYPGFNLTIAKYVKTHTQIPVFYYIAPKVWAWRESRVKIIKAYVDEVFSILPFETDYFRRRGLNVHYVGNPTADEVAEWRDANCNDTADDFIKRNSLTPGKKIIALLAGSRKQEIDYNLRKMCLAAQPLIEKGFQLVLAGVGDIDEELYLRNIPRDMLERKEVKIVYGQTYALLNFATSALVTSGTATLETALFNVPQVVCYYIPMGKIVSFLRRRFLKVRYISLVNLIAGHEVVKELVADGMSVSAAGEELRNITFDPESRNRMLSGYHEVSAALGTTGAPSRAAKEITDCLQSLKK